MRVRGEDADGRPTTTELRFIATGSQWTGRLSSNPDEIELIPERTEYEVGDTAEIILKAPVPDGRYLLTLEREDFRALAVFEPELQTDEHGEAVATFEWPDSLSTYRITAVVMDNDRFGHSEREVLVENPLTVRTALPQQ